MDLQENLATISTENGQWCKLKEPVFHSLHNISLASDNFSGQVDTLLLAPIKAGYDSIVLGRDFLRRYKARVLLNSKEGSMSSSKSAKEKMQENSSVTGVELLYGMKLKRNMYSYLLTLV